MKAVATMVSSPKQGPVRRSTGAREHGKRCEDEGNLIDERGPNCGEL